MQKNDLIPRNREAYSVWTPVNIRYSDQDPMGHVNNVATAAFLESGRIRLLHEIFPGDLMPKQGMVLAHLSIDYLKEMTFPGTVKVGARLSRVGNKSLTGQFAVFQNGECCAISQSVNVFFDPETRRATAPSSELKAALANFFDNQTS